MSLNLVLDNDGKYFNREQLGDLKVRVQINIIHDSKKILRFSEIEGEEHQNNFDLIIKSELYANEKQFDVPKYVKFKNQKSSAKGKEEYIEFTRKYKDIPYNTILCFTIFSSERTHDPQKPVGSSVISLYDSKLRLRTGKYIIIIWPEQPPDTSLNSLTPGLVKDEIIDELYFYNNKLELLASGNQNKYDTDSNLSYLEAVKKIHYNYQRIPLAFLEIEFPQFPHLVLYEEIEYSITAENAEKDSRSKKEVNVEYHGRKGFQKKFNLVEVVQFMDFDEINDRNDPVQEQFLQILRDDDNVQDIKPDKTERETIEKLLVTPIFQELQAKDKNLLWRYRYSLSQNKAALGKFLHSVKWFIEKEEKEALSFLSKWVKIELDEAIHLLSKVFSANDTLQIDKKPIESMIKIRQHAVNVLETTSNDRIGIITKLQQFIDNPFLVSILLQLVVALRYENDIENSPLLQFLIKRGVSDMNFATHLFWYLQVETYNEKKSLADTYKRALEMFQSHLYNQSSESRIIYDYIQNQIELRDRLLKISQKIKASKDTTPQKIEELKKMLSGSEWSRSGFTVHPSCLDPQIYIRGVVPSESTIFKSAMSPMKMSFLSTKSQDQQTDFNYEIIFKSGDDLRQDQLIIQIITLMDNLLKDINIDLKLTPYKVLACSRSDGFLEFVSNSKTLQNILQVNDNKLSQFFNLLVNKKLNAKENSTQNDNQLKFESLYNEILQTYIDSCAGYCVITYLLGIGDRHLENIMIKDDGRFFHIDFGFILGNDPKISPPPFKLCKEMAEGMGGEKSENFEKFKQKCVDTYTYLRKYSKLIVNLFYLMVDSGIKDIDIKAIGKLYDKFRIDENDKNAEIYFRNIINESFAAILSAIFDRVHQLKTDYFSK